MRLLDDSERIVETPDTWRWIELGEISEVVSKGTTPTTVGCAFTAHDIPTILRAEDITGRAVNPNMVAFHIDKKTHSYGLIRSQLQNLEIYLITIAGTLGRVGYVPFNAPQTQIVIKHR